MAPLYFNSTHNTLVNWIIRLLLSLLCWPKVILLSYWLKNCQWNKMFANTFRSIWTTKRLVCEKCLSVFSTDLFDSLLRFAFFYGSTIKLPVFLSSQNFSSFLTCLFYDYLTSFSFNMCIRVRIHKTSHENLKYFS